MKKCVLWLLVFIMMFNSGCIEKKEQGSTSYNKTKSYIVYNLGEMPEDLALLDSRENRYNDLLLELFEGLVKEDENGNIVPALAESYTIDKDELTYTFKIRENAKWSSGEDITAEDFVQFFKEVLNPDIKNNYAYMLYYIFGAKGYNNNLNSFSGVAVKAIDTKTLQIRLNTPAGCFLEILSQPVFSLRKIDDNLKNWEESYKNINYSGPFKIENISQSRELTLLKNSNYYGAEEVNSEKIYITSIESSESALASFQNSNINVFTDPPLSENKTLIIDGEGESIPINRGVSINFNLKKDSIIKNVNFRKSLSYAIDRDSLNREELMSMGRTASAYVPNDTNSTNNSEKYKSFFNEKGDVSLSKSLLKESNYDNRENLKFIYVNSVENKKLCEALVKNIKEALDIDIECDGYDESEYDDIIENGDYNMTLSTYSSFYNDSLSLLEPWVSNSQLNVFGYNNKEFDSLISKAKVEGDKEKREELYKKSEEILINDMAAIPLYYTNILLCKKSNVRDVYVTKEGSIKLDRAYIDNLNNID